MGEVYRARDTKLLRDLALKVLPADVAADADRLIRFEREARSASALNHPNIVTIYEIGRFGTTSYIAMELVAGRTLRDVLSDGPLPIRRFVAIAAQIADGLARAHDAGIVHRDLKPENVMLTRDGVAKILDFGLAKLVEDPAHSQLATVSQTSPGLVQGTVAYMSPEQASGTAVDARSDQFSLGAVLYEMATAKRPFSRNTTAETLAAVIRDEPATIESQVPDFPLQLRWIIERCLAKDPDERYASTRDLARDLAHLRDHISETSQRVSVAAPVSGNRFSGWTRAVPWVVAAAFAAIAVFALLRTQPEPAARLVRFAVPLPAGVRYAPPEVSRAFSISPDGTRMVIEAISNRRRHLYLRPLDSDRATELEGSTDATSHFWSPDGRYLAFFADGKLKKIPTTGGQPQELCVATFAVLGAWGPDGSILFARFDPPGIYRVPDTGGEPDRIVIPDSTRKEETVIWPQFLPDGRRFLYLAGGTGHRELRVASLDSKQTQPVGPLTSRVEYVAPGYLLYGRDGALFAQPFDERNARLHGEPHELASNIHYFFGPSLAAFSASKNGSIAYQTAPNPSRLAWFGRDGKEAGQLGEPAIVKGIRISPDGTNVAMDSRDNRVGSSDIWVSDVGRRTPTRLHSDPADEILPFWSADGSKVIYRSDRHGPPDVWEMTVGNPGSEKRVLQLPAVQQPEDVSRDGQRLAYLNETATTVWNIFLLPLGGDSKPMSWLPSRFSQTSPRFSPDGRWIAYESDESGAPEIYVALTAGGAQKRRISPSGGRWPRWRGDGKELYYYASDGFMMAAAVTAGVQWNAGAPAPLFQGGPDIQNYDVMPDGSRFLVVLPVEKSHESPLRVILNWTEALKEEK
jgi:eukaryotic-like serine/threonine-protein kinase